MADPTLVEILERLAANVVAPDAVVTQLQQALAAAQRDDTRYVNVSARLTSLLARERELTQWLEAAEGRVTAAEALYDAIRCFNGDYEWDRLHDDIRAIREAWRKYDATRKP